MDFLFFWEKGDREKGFGAANVNWGFEGRWENKSGIRRFYRRVWKNIFYEMGDKERERGVLEIFWVMYGKGCNMEYSLMECFL